MSTTACLVARLAAWLAGRVGALWHRRLPPLPCIRSVVAGAPRWSVGWPLAAIALLAVAVIPARVVEFALADVRERAKISLPRSIVSVKPS